MVCDIKMRRFEKLLWIACALLVVACSEKLDLTTLAPAPQTPPQWANSAIWYYVPSSQLGDEAKFSAELTKLDSLGVNTLLISPFPDSEQSALYNDARWRHVSGSSVSEPQDYDEEHWEFSPDDERILRFIQQANELGLRVIIDFPFSLLDETQDNKESKATQLNDRHYLFNLVKRWLDPNQDGNTNDGVSGFRFHPHPAHSLDVWQDVRKFIKSVEPQAHMLASLSREPKQRAKQQKVLAGDSFDAVENYDWKLSTNSAHNPNSSIDLPFRLANINLTGGKSIYSANINKEKFFLAKQFTLQGAIQLPSVDAFVENDQLNEALQFFVKLRQESEVLQNGEIEFYPALQEQNVNAYRRFNEQGEQVYVALNNGNRKRLLTLPATIVDTKRWYIWSLGSTEPQETIPNELTYLPANSVLIIATSK